MNVLSGEFPFYYQMFAGFSNRELRIDPAWRIGKGHKRLVYRLPNERQLVLKIDRGNHAGRCRFGLMRRSENLREAFWCNRIHDRFPGCPYAPQIFGFMQTEYGIALVEEYICNADGSPALHPGAFIQRHGRSAEVMAATETLFRFLADQHVVCNDISASNILIRIRDGRPQAVLIDGYGENHLIPYPTLSKSLNREKLKRKAQRVRRQVAISAL